MEFAFDARTEDLRESLLDFMGSHVYPAEPVFTRSSAGSRTSGPGTRYR
jgi:acyl-CoA dehydrogenase